MFYFDIKDYFFLNGILNVGLGWYIRAIFIDGLFFNSVNSFQLFNSVFFAHLLEYFKNDYIFIELKLCI